ncbi:hypothetical protein BGY98DRAFT_1041524, partial [Russula aff. rugulosa BPL654]
MQRLAKRGTAGTLLVLGLYCKELSAVVGGAVHFTERYHTHALSTYSPRYNIIICGIGRSSVIFRSRQTRCYETNGHTRPSIPAPKGHSTFREDRESVTTSGIMRASL